VKTGREYSGIMENLELVNTGVMDYEFETQFNATDVYLRSGDSTSIRLLWIKYSFCLN